MSQLVPLSLPRKVALPVSRTPQKNIPQTRRERERLRRTIREYVDQAKPVPPLSQEELRAHTLRVAEISGADPLYQDFIAVLLSNEAWRESLAAVPYERRLLLLPKCLRVEDHCTAPFDEFGLLCKKCGLCTIQDLQEEAERLGYAVLVAEGSAIVMAIIETGRIDAVVGVSCLSVLERAFPYVEAAAIPGVAIPLLQDDCRDTNVDLEWVWDVIHLNSADKTRRLDLNALRGEVQSWFTPEALEEVLGPPEGETEEIARQWLAGSGKRWRPFLAACAYRSFQDDPETDLPADLRKVALAVECFHKASLIHDDIEDQDALRYGEKTLHEEYGVPVALNVGDLLVGEGYRIIAECGASPRRKAEMLRVAARGHRSLCLGQGAELCWARKPEPLSPVQVLDIFRRKTAPAFEVALRLGSIYAGAEEDASDVLGRYSESLGIAYQIRDDLRDASDEAEASDLAGLRPSVLLAIAHEKARGRDKDELAAIWRRSLSPEKSVSRLQDLYAQLKVEKRTRELMESYKQEAIRSLADLENANLKGLLRRVVGKIFDDLEIKGWCSEFEARNAPGASVGAEPAA